MISRTESAVAILLFTSAFGSACLVLQKSELFPSFVLAAILSILVAIDANRFVLPNTLTLLLTASGLLDGSMAGQDAFFDRLLGTVLGFAAFAGIGWLYTLLRRRQGLGLGDAKLLGGLGAWVGLDGLPSIVLLAAMGGICFALLRQVCTRSNTLNDPLAFGPFLALSGWMVWLYGPLW